MSAMFARPAAAIPGGGGRQSSSSHKNLEVIAALCQALTQSAPALQGNHDLPLELVPEYTKIDDAVAQDLTLPHYDSELDVDALQYGADLMEKYDITSGPLDIEDLVIE